MNKIFELTKPVSNKLFLKLATKISKNLENVRKDYLFMRNINLLFEEYLASSMFLSLCITIVSTVVIAILLYLSTNSFPIVFIALAIFYGILVGLLSLMYFLSCPRLAKSDYRKSLEDNLPIALLYLSNLIKSGLGVLESLEILSKRKEFGAVAEEAKYIVTLTIKFGVDLITALDKTAANTPSETFKEFLYSLVSVIKSGGDVKEVIHSYARESLVNYELRLREYEEKTHVLMTLYTFIFIAFPLIFLIITFLFSYITGNVSILSSVKYFFLLFLPMSYLIYIYAIYLIQPTL